MKIKLSYSSGKYQNGHWATEWSRTYEGRSIYSTSGYHIIGGVSTFSDSILVHLNDIPERIDRDSSGAIWLLDDDGVRRYPQPLHLLDNETSETLFTKEAANVG